MNLTVLIIRVFETYANYLSCNINNHNTCALIININRHLRRSNRVSITHTHTTSGRPSRLPTRDTQLFFCLFLNGMFSNLQARTPTCGSYWFCQGHVPLRCRRKGLNAVSGGTRKMIRHFIATAAWYMAVRKKSLKWGLLWSNFDGGTDSGPYFAMTVETFLKFFFRNDYRVRSWFYFVKIFCRGTHSL